MLECTFIMHCSLFCKRTAALGLALIMMLSCFVIGVYAEDTQKNAAAEQGEFDVLSDGYYRIRNLATGLYLDSYDLRYDPQGPAYLDKATGQNGQDFFVSRNTDGTYTLVGQSDDAKYAVSHATGSHLTKSVKRGETESFDIVRLSENAYVVLPAYTKNTLLSISASDLKTNHGFTHVTLATYDDQLSQQWAFEPVPVTGISLAYTATRVKLWTLGTFYAAVAPYPVTAIPMKWTSDNEDVLMIDDTGAYCTVGVGKAKVTVTCGNYSASCVVEVHDSDAFAFFSQHNISGSYWNGNALSGIYFSYGATKRYAVDRYNRNGDWMDEGCALSSHAMLLRNLGATLTEGYDFRSGQNGNLPADPYTVSLANTGNTGARAAKATLYGNPVLVNHNRIADRFKVDGKALTVTQYYYPSLKQIKEALDKHPEGVVVGMKNAYNGSHYFLFTECLNPEEKNPYNYKFRVCDPAAYDLSQGDNIPFEQCYSYRSLYYRYSNIACMMVWDVVE